MAETAAGVSLPSRLSRSPAADSAWRAVGITRLSSLYGLVAVVLFFWLVLRPGEWISSTNLTVVLSEVVIVGLLAVGAVIPMSASMLDISFASIAGFGLGFGAWLCIHTSLNDWLIALIVVAACGLFGLGSGVLVAALGLPSLIVTLGMSSVALAVDDGLLGGNTLYPRPHFTRSFSALGSGDWGPVPVSATVLVAIALCAYLWTEHTPSGRRLLAVGGNMTAARLAGVRCGRYQMLSLTLSALVAGVAGVVLVSSVGTADDVTAPAYLLPVIAAVFLGSTQIKNRFNVAWTVLAAVLLATVLNGIELTGSNQWVNFVFDGVVLLVAVTVSRGRRNYGL